MALLSPPKSMTVPRTELSLSTGVRERFFETAFTTDVIPFDENTAVRMLRLSCPARPPAVFVLGKSDETMSITLVVVPGEFDALIRCAASVMILSEYN